MTVIDGIPTAIHRGIDELPFVDIGDGSQLQVMHVDTDRGLWIIRNRFAPGMRVQTHKHTGEVWAFTLAGAWKYEEYPEVNRAGSYLYEPAGSIHTLKVLDDNTELTDVIFHMTGSNLNLDADGNVESVFDGAGTLEFYIAMCESSGFGTPPVVGA